MKKYYFWLVVVVAFVLGLFVGKGIYHQPTKYLSVGIPDDSLGAGAVRYDENMKMTNLDFEDEAEIDNVERMIYGAQAIEDVEAPRELPDYTLDISAVNRGVSFIRTELWFTEDGAIFGNRDYGSTIIKNAHKLSKDTAGYIKDIIERLESNR